MVDRDELLGIDAELEQELKLLRDAQAYLGAGELSGSDLVAVARRSVAFNISGLEFHRAALARALEDETLILPCGTQARAFLDSLRGA